MSKYQRLAAAYEDYFRTDPLDTAERSRHVALMKDIYNDDVPFDNMTSFRSMLYIEMSVVIAIGVSALILRRQQGLLLLILGTSSRSSER